MSVSCHSKQKISGGYCRYNNFHYEIKKDFCFGYDFKVNCKSGSKRNCVKNIDLEPFSFDNQNKHVLSFLEYFDHQGNLISLEDSKCDTLVLVPLDDLQVSQCGDFCFSDNVVSIKEGSQFSCLYNPSASIISEVFPEIIQTISVGSVCKSELEEDSSLSLFGRRNTNVKEKENTDIRELEEKENEENKLLSEKIAILEKEVEELLKKK